MRYSIKKIENAGTLQGWLWIFICKIISWNLEWAWVAVVAIGAYFALGSTLLKYKWDMSEVINKSNVQEWNSHWKELHTKL